MLERFAYIVVVSVLSELDGIFTIKDLQIMTLKAFLGGQHAFALWPTGSGNNLVKHRGT